MYDSLHLGILYGSAKQIIISKYQRFKIASTGYAANVVPSDLIKALLL
ncbi:MAG: hypothetical protein ACR5K4_03400 [Sodalis sp. (in: enterobacteria)]